MKHVSKEVLQDSIIVLESQLSVEERNMKIHRVSSVDSENLRVMLGILRNELGSRM